MSRSLLHVARMPKEVVTHGKWNSGKWNKGKAAYNH
jgi:hypothetical protein